jgi:hypothetical protein
MLLATRDPFDSGMRAVLWTAAGMSLAAALVWWRAAATTRHEAHPRHV